ncbi:hypothetical protein ACRYCC_10170 [Actinomadura scrupuli]|uniref:hypothetical protein n=1 Tax=Actinomadura scrupuli TaxID=559629 RepID=UPI003D972F92
MRSAVPLRIAAVLTVIATAGLFAGGPATAAEPRPLQAAPTPWLWPRSGLEAVSATGPNDVWAAGYQGYQGIDWSVPGWGAGTIHVVPPKAMVVRWNGTSWNTYDLPGTSGDAVAQEIDAVSPDNVWVTGTLYPHDSSKSAPYVAHWDGTRWQQVPGPGGCRPQRPAADSTGAWFSCAPGLFRWQNGQWTKQDAGAPDACCIGVDQISVVSDDSAWAASTWGLLHWDGHGWSTIPGFDGVNWTRVTAFTDTDVWATGRKWTGSSTVQVSVRWDGRTWQEFPTTPSNERLIRTGDGTMWALQSFWGELYRLEGGAWTRVSLPVPSGGHVTGGTPVPGSPALWLVGKTPNVPVVINNR